MDVWGVVVPAFPPLAWQMAARRPRKRRRAKRLEAKTEQGLGRPGPTLLLALLLTTHHRAYSGKKLGYSTSFTTCQAFTRRKIPIHTTYILKTQAENSTRYAGSISSLFH